MGNKAAVFPLQLLGFDVDVINSVNFSNHTGYQNGFKGEVLSGDQLLSLLDGLERNALVEDTRHLLTGYIGSESFLRAVLDVLSALRKNGRSVRYVCDPVLGDRGNFYVPRDLVDVYKELVLPVADVLTPNQFEVEQLTGISIRSLKDAKDACSHLHGCGPALVVITSVQFEDRGDILAVLASQRVDGSDSLWMVECPLLPGQFTGTGDLFASLLLAHTAQPTHLLPVALEKVMNTMYAVLKRTLAQTKYPSELQLIQSKNDIEDPPHMFKVYQLED